MITTATWNVDPVKIVPRRELDDLVQRSPRSANTRMNLTMFRLACRCGLRVMEIGALRLEEVCVG